MYPSSKFRPRIWECCVGKQVEERSGEGPSAKFGFNCLHLRRITYTTTLQHHPHTHPTNIPYASHTHYYSHGLRFFETSRPPLRTKARHSSPQQTQTTEASAAYIQESCPRSSTHRWHVQLTVRNRRDNPHVRLAWPRDCRLARQWRIPTHI